MRAVGISIFFNKLNCIAYAWHFIYMKNRIFEKKHENNSKKQHHHHQQQ